MKINKYIYMLMTGAIVLGNSACVDVNDWDVDSSYDRLFMGFVSKYQLLYH